MGADQYKDQYKAALMELIEEKARKRPPSGKPVAPRVGVECGGSRHCPPAEPGESRHQKDGIERSEPAQIRKLAGQAEEKAGGRLRKPAFTAIGLGRGALERDSSSGSLEQPFQEGSLSRIDLFFRFG